MQAFWNERYAQNETVYGQIPNTYFKLKIDALQPSKILLPAEGEGRNAVYAASIGWQVDAFDYSGNAQKKRCSWQIKWVFKSIMKCSKSMHLIAYSNMKQLD